MEKNDMKQCPYCAELIKKEAIKCRYCGSMLTKKEFKLDFLSTPGYWHRVNEGKKIAGVCTGIAKQLDSPILLLPLRIFFLLTAIFYAFGAILYIILWILMPAPVEPSGGTKTGVHAAGTEPVTTEETPVTSEDTDEAESPDTQEGTEAKMVGFPRELAILAVMFVIPVFCYFFVLNNVIGIAVSPLLLLLGVVAAGTLLTGTVVALRHKKIIPC